MSDSHLHHDTHLHHHETHFQGSELLTDIVIGMSDGLTVPFALAAGLSGAVSNSHIILTAGIAEIVAGSIAMGLGGYLSGRTEVDHYAAELKREYEETELYPEVEKEEVRKVFADYGMSKTLQNQIADEMALNKDNWVNFMMRYELGLEKPDAKRAGNAAFNIGASYIVGGLVPLLPYAIFSNVHEGLMASCVVTLIALFIFGYFKSRIIGQNAIKGAFQTLMIGAAAAAAAFGIAKFFNHD